MLGSFGYALPVGRIFGIPVSIHWSLFALVIGFLLHDLARYPAAVAGLAFVVGALSVLSILIHELAHALAAHRFGCRTRSIELHAFGGVAQIVGGAPTSAQAARNDILIALAGPAANFVLYALLAGVASAVSPFGWTQLVLLSAARFNLLIGAFNLVPCFPLDGGRALLGGLRLKMGPVHGDRLAYTVGLYIAAPGMILAILISQPVMALLFYIAFDACRQHRAALDSSFGPSRSDGASLWERVRGWFAPNREPRPPKLRVIRGGRYEEPGVRSPESGAKN